MCEETFAPIAPISRFETEAEVLERANRSRIWIERIRDDA